MLQHYGDMHCVTRREFPIPQDNLLRAFHNCLINGQQLIDGSKQCVENRLDCIAAVNGHVAMQNFLEHLGIRDQSLSVCDQPLQQSLRICLVHVRRADKVHWNIGIDENHE